MDLQDLGVIDSGCLRHMIGNMSYLIDYEEIDGGYVAFGGNPKGGKITGKGAIKTANLDFENVYFVRELKFNLFSVSQMCDKKNSVLFNDTECIVLSPNFKLIDKSQVLLRVHRKNNMYSVDLKNIVPKGVAKRRNRTLIKAVRTMLADSMLPTTFWAEAVSTACYVQNRMLIVKPHNKTPYELFQGRMPTLSFMRPFGCPVTIPNTMDHLGKFDGKADEGFFIGYSLNSKAFRVFNSRTRIVEEKLHIRFRENTPNVVRSGPDWLFATKASDNAGQARKETRPVKDYILLPLWTANPPYSQDPKSSQDDGSKPSSDDGKKVDDDPREESESNDQEKEYNVNRTNNVNVASTNEVNIVGEDISIELQYDLKMHALEDISINDFISDKEDNGAEADMNNLDTTIQVKEPKKVIHALKDPSWIKAIQEELLQFKLQEVWTLGDLPNGKRAIGTKWVYRNKKDDRGIMIRNKARLVAHGHTYKKKGLTMMKYLPLLQELKQLDDIIFSSTKKELCIAFEKLIHEKFQMSSMGELTFFLGLQVKKKKDGIFISQDKYVARILKKFGFTNVKTASTPMETQKPLLKDEDGEEVDVYMYRSMIGSLMYLTSSRSDIMFAVCTCARYEVNPKVSHLHAVKEFLAYTDSDYAGASLDRKSTTGVNAHRHKTYYCWVTTAGSKSMLLRVPQPSSPADIVSDEAIHKELGDSLVRAATTASSLESEQDSGNITKTRSKATPNESSSLELLQVVIPGNTLRSDEDSIKLKEFMELCTNLQQRVLDLEKTKTTQQNEIASLKRRVKKLEQKKRLRTHGLKRLHKVGMSRRVESSGDEEDLDDADNEMFDVDALNDEEVFVAEQEVANEKDDDGEITLAQALIEIKSTKPKVKGVVIQEPCESTTTKSLQLSSQQSQDKGKGIMIEEPVKPMKKKHQISFDEEVTLKLQAKFDEEERLARENVEKEKEANIALTEEWDDIQAKIEADHELAQRLQAEEQEELSVEGKAKLSQQLLEQRRKHFAAKRAKEQRNKPPTQAQQRKIICTYLK
ncbi:retrovirus-related pol polyprotein from transposon TNT 1-94, partial [Tanacetum coccineum]